MKEFGHGVLVLLRHGQSQWNKENRFTGWVDIDLSPGGIEQCRQAAKRLVGIRFDVAFTSQLRRAWLSLDIILEELGLNIPVVRNRALNERCYGILRGMNKDEAAKRFGQKRVQRWRRGFYARPPHGESLADTYRRVVPFFKKTILPELRRGRTVLIVAHGNSLRALVMYLEKLSPREIRELEIPTALPLFYNPKNGRYKKTS